MLTITSTPNPDKPVSGYSFGLPAGFNHRHALYRQLLTQAMLNAGDVILEVSCNDAGSGRITAKLNVLDKGPLGGMPGMLEILSVETGFGQSGQTGEDLPWTAGSFGTIVCLGVFNYLADPGETIGRLRKLLAPGGRLIIADQWFRSAGPMFPDLLQTYAKNGRFRIFSPASVTCLLRKSGFDQIQTHSAGTTNFICTATVKL